MAFSKPMLNEIKLLMEMNKKRQVELYNSDEIPTDVKPHYYEQIKAVWAWHEMIVKELEKISG